MEATATIKTAYIGPTAIWGFFSNADERIGFDMSASPAVRIAGSKVLGARGAALPADATDLASVITLANTIKARLSAASGTVEHPLFA